MRGCVLQQQHHGGPQGGLWGCTRHCCINRFGELGVARATPRELHMSASIIPPLRPSILLLPPILRRARVIAPSCFTTRPVALVSLIVVSLSLADFRTLDSASSSSFSCVPTQLSLVAHGATGHTTRLFSSHLLCKRTQSRQSDCRERPPYRVPGTRCGPT